MAEDPKDPFAGAVDAGMTGEEAPIMEEAPQTEITEVQFRCPKCGAKLEAVEVPE